MKLGNLLGLLLIFCLIAIAYGYYEVYYGEVAMGHRIIGGAVVFIFLILMPVFIWYRYKNKDLSSFRLDQDDKSRSESDDTDKG